MPLALRFNDGVLRSPKLERHMLGGMREVLVRREQGQFMAPAQLNQQRVDRADLYTRASTGISDLRRSNVVLPVRVDEWQCLEPLDDGRRCAWSVEPLKKFLKNKPSSYDRIRASQCFHENANLWPVR